MKNNYNNKNCFIYFCVFIFLIIVSFLLNIVIKLKNKKTLNQSNFVQLKHPTLTAIKNVDAQLRKLANNDYNNKVVFSIMLNTQNKTVLGPKMHSAKEIIHSTKVIIEPKNPCYGNFGKKQLLLVIMPIIGKNFNRRHLIRQTYRSKFNNNLISSFYFLTAQDNDPM